MSTSWMDDRQEEYELKCAPATVVRSIDWCQETPTVKGLETVALADIETDNPSNDGCIPSLVSLAQAKHEANLQDKAYDALISGMKQMGRLAYQADMEIEQVYRGHKNMLLQSNEAAVVCQLRALLEKAEDKLTKKALQLCDTADSERDAILTRIAIEKKAAQAEVEEKKSEILNEHLSFLDYCSESCPNDDCNAISLCVNERCRKTFIPNDLPERKRCTHPECVCILSNCGCRTGICDVCHNTVRSLHVKEHKRICHEPAENKYGYCFDHGLLPAFCHKELDADESRECFYCLVKCCLNCRRICQCGSVW